MIELCQRATILDLLQIWDEREAIEAPAIEGRLRKLFTDAEGDSEGRMVRLLPWHLDFVARGGGLCGSAT